MTDSTAALRAGLKREYIAAKGFWPEVHDALLQLDPQFLRSFLELSQQASARQALEPKVREFIAIAIDASTTHLYNTGTRNHIRQALRLGASVDEILEVLEITSLLGIHTLTESAPILLEAINDMLDDDQSAKEGGPMSSTTPSEVTVGGRVIPDYDDLARVPGGVRSGWGVFGDSDAVGRFNMLTAECVVNAAKLVRTGEVFALNLALDHFPRLAHRTAPRHELQRRGPDIYGGHMIAYDELLHDFNPQGSSQWDALAHASANASEFYNGATDVDIETARMCTVDHWARRGIAGRGILLDVANYLTSTNSGYDVSSAPAVTVADLEATAHAAGIEFRSGDILLVNTGFLDWVDSMEPTERDAVMTSKPLRFVGLERCEEMARWLWNRGLSAVATDAPGVEQFPVDFSLPFGSMHRVLIGWLGFPLGELFDLRALSRSCADDGVYEFMLTSAPLNIRGGVGSPPNALAIK